MPNLPQSGIELIADTARYLSDMGAAIGISEELDAALGDIIDIASEVSASLGDISADVDTSALEELTSNIEGLEDADVDITATADTSEVDELVTTVDGIEDTTVNVATEIDPQPVLDFDINLRKIITTAGAAGLAIAGIGAAAVAGLAVTGVKAVLDFDDSLDLIEVRLGRTLPGAEEAITELFLSGFADSREQAAEFLILADQLGISIAELGTHAQDAFVVAKGQGADFAQVLATADRLVDTGLAPNLDAAFDVINTGFQQGANLNGDFLTTLRNSADVMVDLGLDAESATALIIAGAQEAMGAQESLNLLLIARQRLSDASPDVQDALRTLGIEDIAEDFLANEATANEFFSAVSGGLRNIEDDAERLEATLAIFGPRGARGLGAEALIRLGEFEKSLEDVEGSVERTAATIENDLGTSITKVFRLGEERAREFMSSDQINLKGKLETLENQLETFFTELESGESIGGALEVALELPGLEDQIARIESAFGNAAIVFAEAIAGALELFGRGDLAAEIRESLAPLAEGQLAFDLKTTIDPEEIESQILTAVDRGVSAEGIRGAFETAINEMLASGDVAGAQALADAYSQAIAEGIGREMTVPNAPWMAGPEGVVEVPLDLALDATSPETQAAIDEASLALLDQLQTAIETGDFDLARALAEDLPGGEAWEPVIQGAEQAALAWQNQLAAMELEAIALANATHEQFVQHSITSDLEAVATAAATHMPAAIGWFNLFRTAVVVGAGQMNVALDAVALKLGNLIANAQGLAATIVNIQNAGGGGTTNNTTNFNQTNNISNGAAGNNVVNQTADAIGGAS